MDSGKISINRTPGSTASPSREHRAECFDGHLLASDQNGYEVSRNFIRGGMLFRGSALARLATQVPQCTQGLIVQFRFVVQPLQLFRHLLALATIVVQHGRRVCALFDTKSQLLQQLAFVGGKFVDAVKPGKSGAS